MTLLPNYGNGQIRGQRTENTGSLLMIECTHASTVISRNGRYSQERGQQDKTRFSIKPGIGDPSRKDVPPRSNTSLKVPLNPPTKSKATVPFFLFSFHRASGLPGCELKNLTCAFTATETGCDDCSSGIIDSIMPIRSEIYFFISSFLWLKNIVRDIMTIVLSTF